MVASSIIVCSYQVVDDAENWCKTIGETPDSSIQSLAFDPSGKTVVTGLKIGLEKGEIILWDVSKGVQNLVIQTDLNLMSTPTWSPDGQKLAYTTSDRAGNGTIQIWNSRDGSILQHIKAVPYLPDILSWSPDGSTIAGSDFSGLITLWDALSGDELSFHRIFPQQHAVSSLAWSPDSTELLAGSRYISCAENCSPTFDGKIVLIDAQSGAQRWQIDAGQVIDSLEISPDGTLLLAEVSWYRSEVSQYHHEVRLYRMSDGSLVRTVTLASTSQIEASKHAFWFPDSQRLLTLNGEGNLAVWDTSGAKRSEVHLEEYVQLFGLAWSPDSTRLVTSSYQGTIFVWNNATGQLLRKFEGEGMGASPVAWSADGKQIASSGSQGVIIWDEATGKRQQVLAVSNTTLYDLSWSADGRYFAALSPDDGITLWDAHSWLVLKTINKIGYAVAMAWSPDGKTLATAGMNVILWDTTSGEQVGVLGQDTATDSIAWSPDGSKIAAASGGWLVIWDVKTGQDLLQATSGQSYYAQSVALSPDGQILASAAGELILRDARNGEILQTLEGHSDADQLVFSPDGKTLASGSYDGTVVLWDMTH